MRKINLIVLHCSATRETMEYTPEQLERDHKARGFFSAGYNYYIRRSGEVVPMRPPEQIPAHAKGYNAFSLGICYEGGLGYRRASERYAYGEAKIVYQGIAVAAADAVSGMSDLRAP